MANQEAIDEVRAAADEILAFDLAKLTARPDWGPFNFNDVSNELKVARDMAGYMRQLPIELVPADYLLQFRDRLRNVRDVMAEVDRFSLVSSGNATQERAALAENLREYTKQMLSGLQGWIGFLAYQNGDVQQNIAALVGARDSALRIVSKLEGDVKDRVATLDGVISAARVASAKAGVGVFTRDFADAASTLETAAEKWLIGTAALGAVTLAAAVGSGFIPVPKDATPSFVIHLMTSKVIALLVLLTATIWCGRLYKATKHQAATNRHRANALQTFQAFAQATEDSATKEAVLLETTRSIFAIAPNGYLDSSEPAIEPSAKMLEIVKTAKPNS